MPATFMMRTLVLSGCRYAADECTKRWKGADVPAFIEGCYCLPCTLQGDCSILSITGGNFDATPNMPCNDTSMIITG